MNCTVCYWPLIHGDEAEQLYRNFHMVSPNHWFCERCNYEYINGLFAYEETIGEIFLYEPKSNHRNYENHDPTMFSIGKIQLINKRRYELWRWSIIPIFIPFATDNFYQSYSGDGYTEYDGNIVIVKHEHFLRKELRLCKSFYKGIK